MPRTSITLYEHAGGREWTPTQHDAWKKPWAAYPRDLAEARERVIEAARALDAAERSSKDDLHEWMRCYRVLREAVAALDALEAPGTEGGSNA